MGDRAYTQIEVCTAHLNQKVSDRQTLEELLETEGFPSEDTEDTAYGTRVFEDCEANYGGQSTTDALCETGLPFFGYNDAGGGYPAAVFAFDGKEYADAVGAEQQPMVPVGDDGQVDADALKHAHKYQNVYRQARERMKEAVAVVA